MHGQVKRGKKVVAPRKRSGGVVQFDPTKTRLKLASFREAIKHAARIRDWDALETAVDEVVNEQRKFVACWQADVTPGRDQLPDGNRAVVAKRRQQLIPAAEATKATGVTKQQVSKWKRHLADESAYRKELRESAYVPMWARRDGSQLNQQSLSDEHYTPAQYLEAARLALGGIDLDPASCREANRIVKAEKFFSKKDDGLAMSWIGRVWLNPPYGRLVGDFIGKFIEEYRAKHITAGIILVNAHCTDTDWFQPLFDGLLCFTNHRINFYGDDERSGSTHGSVFVYFGESGDVFIREFSAFGAVVARA